MSEHDNKTDVAHDAHDVHIRGFAPDIYAEIKRQAEENGRSVEAELRTIVSKSISASLKNAALDDRLDRSQEKESERTRLAFELTREAHRAMLNEYGHLRSTRDAMLELDRQRNVVYERHSERYAQCLDAMAYSSERSASAIVRIADHVKRLVRLLPVVRGDDGDDRRNSNDEREGPSR